MQMTKPIIETRDIRKNYQSGKVPTETFQGVSLKVEKGDFVAVLVHSGTGQPTPLNLTEVQAGENP